MPSYTPVTEESGSDRYNQGCGRKLSGKARDFEEQTISFRSAFGIAVVVLFVLSVPVAKADDPALPVEPAKAKPVHVAKGKGYVICVIPHKASDSPFAKYPKPPGLMRGLLPGRGKASKSPGASVLHISFGDGAVKCLLASGVSETPYHSPPMGSMGHVTFFQSRILGVCADRQRLYVLVLVGQTGGFGFEGRNSMYYLSVFDAREGTWLLDVDLKDAEIPTRPHLETLDTGPMKSLDNGVTVYGKTFRFDGKILVVE